MEYDNDKKVEQYSYSDLFSTYPDVVTVKELQAMLRLSRTQTYALVHSGEINYFAVGTSIRITKSEVIDYIKRLSVRASSGIIFM